MAEKIPCPMAGCDKEFDDEAAAIAHLKAEHKDDFAPGSTPLVRRGPGPDPDADKLIEMGQRHDSQRGEDAGSHSASDEPPQSMIPPEALALLDKRIDDRVSKALDDFKPELQEAVAGAIKKVVDQAAAAGIAVPGVTGGGVVPGSPVTPTGAAFMQWLMGQGQKTDMEQLATTLTQARAISDVLNPPSIWDRVMQNAVLRSLAKAGLVTAEEEKLLTEPPAKP